MISNYKLGFGYISKISLGRSVKAKLDLFCSFCPKLSFLLKNTKSVIENFLFVHTNY